MTDDSWAYDFKLTQYRHAKHRTVNHSKDEYVRGEVHTNTVESAFSLLKRGIVGSFHQISAKHLHRYLSEFQFRFDRREMPDLFGATVARMAGPGNRSTSSWSRNKKGPWQRASLFNFFREWRRGNAPRQFVSRSDSLMQRCGKLGSVLKS